MGHTLTEWQTKVAELVRDAGNVDFTPAQITTVGIQPALAQFSTDRPRVLVTEVAGGVTPYFDLPAGWVADFSTLVEVEAPARANPPTVLDGQSWRLVRSTADVNAFQILLDRTPATTQYVRFAFTAPWPTPTTVAGTDKISDVAFEAVAALAASKCCLSMVGESSRARWGVLPTDSTNQQAASGGRTQQLIDAAKMYRAAYDSYLGLASSGAGSTDVPASGFFDLDPSFGSVFHGGRR